jgi:ankyrin repeat protein
MNQTRQLLIQTYRNHTLDNTHNTHNTHNTPQTSHDMYLDVCDLADDKKWDRIIDTLHSFPQESIPSVAKKLIGRLLREKNFTQEVVSLLDHISSGCSLEMRIYQILMHNGSIEAMRYYLERGAPVQLQKHDIPFPSDQFKCIVPVLSSMSTLPKGLTMQMYYGPVHASLLCHVIDRGGRQLMDNLQLLLSLGADPNAEDMKTGRTPLMEWAKTFYWHWYKYKELLPLDTLLLLLEKVEQPSPKEKERLSYWIKKADNYQSIPPEYIRTLIR